VRLAPQEVPVEGVDGRRADPDEDAVIARRRRFDVTQGKDIR
jgi:hypothetical protein